MQGQDLIRLDLPSSPRYLHILGTCIQEMLAEIESSDKEMTIYSIQLAAHEGCTNVIDHAYAGGQGRIAITLSLVPQPARFICEIHDTGSHTFDPTAVPEPGEDDERGRGLLLIRQLMDRVIYCSRKGHRWQSIAGGPWERQEQAACHSFAEGNYWYMVKHL